MDELLRSKWAQVYQGNSASRVDTIFEYCAKYAKFLFKASQFVVPDITGQDIFDAAATARNTGSGLDV